jgi:transcriptional regulator with XRE-family HTH domain
MPVRERVVDAGGRRGRQLVLMVGAELRGGRRMAGISQDALGAAVGLSGSEVGRIERGEASWLTIVHASKLLSAVGLNLWARAYPAGPPIRDVAHLRLLADFETRLPASIRCQREWPIPDVEDRRALDLLLVGLPCATGVEAETMLDDLQALERDMNLKRRDAHLERMFLLVRDSRRNREILRSADALRRSFPLRTRAVMAALGRGRDPGADGIVVLQQRYPSRRPDPPYGARNGGA